MKNRSTCGNGFVGAERGGAGWAIHSRPTYVPVRRTHRRRHVSPPFWQEMKAQELRVDESSSTEVCANCSTDVLDRAVVATPLRSSCRAFATPQRNAISLKMQQHCVAKLTNLSCLLCS